MNDIECAKNIIKSIVDKSGVEEDPIHARNTVKWLFEIRPRPDEALIIAALGHDLERAVAEKRVRKTDYPDYDSYKAAHAENSARLLKKVLEDCRLPRDLVEEVQRLVRLHEVGGDPRSDLINYADSLSFFEVNLPYYFKRRGWEESRIRALWGWRRLSPDMRKFVIRKRYQEPELNRLLDSIVRL